MADGAPDCREKFDLSPGCAGANVASTSPGIFTHAALARSPSPMKNNDVLLIASSH